MNRLFTLGLMIVGLASCEQPVSLDIDEPDPQLVVISNFTDSKEMQVRVSKTRSVLDSGAPVYLTEADVRLYEEETFIQRLQLVNGKGETPPYYTTVDFEADFDVTYTIKVAANGFEPIEAISRVPSKIDIQSLKVSNYLIEKDPEGEANYRFAVTIGFTDPPLVNNYYHLNLHQQIYHFTLEERDTLFGNSEFFPIQFNQIIDDNFVLAYFDGGVLFEDTPFNGNIVSYTFPISFTLPADEKVPGKLLVELRSVSEEYYRYQRSLSQQQANPGAPFAEPVGLYNNIINGQGIFAGYSASMDSIRVGR